MFDDLEKRARKREQKSDRSTQLPGETKPTAYHLRDTRTYRHQGEIVKQKIESPEAAVAKASILCRHNQRRRLA